MDAGQLPRVLHRPLLPALALALDDPGRGDGDRVLGAGHHGGLPARALRLRRPQPVQLPHHDPDHLAPAGGGAGLHLHPRARGHRERAPDGSLRPPATGELPLRHPRGRARRDAPPLPDDHAQRGGRARQGRPLAGGGGGECGGARVEQALAGDPAAHHPGLRGGGAARVHLDLLRFRDAAGAGGAGSPGPAGLPQHRAVRGPAHLPHGHRDLRADGGARGPLPARGTALRGDQGLLVALLQPGRPAAPHRGPAGAGGGLPVAPAAAVVHPLHRGDARLGGEGLGAHPAAGGLHAAVLRARDRGDAQVHPQQLPLLRARGGGLRRWSACRSPGCSRGPPCRGAGRSTRSTP